VTTISNNTPNGVRIDIPNTNPQQVFACNRGFWWIERLGPYGNYYTNGSSNQYNTVGDLRRALDLNFRKEIANSQFNLWLALDKFADVVHSRL
jgi:hypothetical protein